MVTTLIANPPVEVVENIYAYFDLLTKPNP